MSVFGVGQERSVSAFGIGQERYFWSKSGEICESVWSRSGEIGILTGNDGEDPLSELDWEPYSL